MGGHAPRAALRFTLGFLLPSRWGEGAACFFSRRGGGGDCGVCVAFGSVWGPPLKLAAPGVSAPPALKARQDSAQGGNPGNPQRKKESRPEGTPGAACF